ncbi:hypothetical protein KP77_04460 [Jeotgalibacillus alimentarius]|uniref:Uncharacterized protein n=1 Tax=Jeotgalibacillus alimentarius TaxID=135826 RepID=A0A0C2RTB1_9BACL|nr:hypothetical protein KP77_04460 [Jeotgalibacillus alimentarius]
MTKTPIYIFNFINAATFFILAIVFSQFDFNLYITLIIFGSGSLYYLLRGIYNYKKAAKNTEGGL